EPDSAQCLDGRWRFGRTVIERTGTTVTIHVDCDVPGSVEPLRGSLAVSGPAWTEVQGATPVSERTHGWCPQLGPCRAQGLLTHGPRQFSYNGPAYADRNAGDRPLHDLGIQRWVWGRATFDDETRIAYVLWPEDGGPPTPLAIRVRADGVAQVSEGVVSAGPDGWSPWGEGTPKTLCLDVQDVRFITLTAEQQVDSSPFYARAVGRGTAPGRESVPAVIESCTPSRIDPGWFRPFLTMATHNVGGANSIWLPLFNGPHEGRWRRLLSSWRGVGRS
ncbi:MAG: carotenoid 1,2-hydratase, partial [Myxococcota bacterium]